MKDSVSIIVGRSNPKIGELICEHLGVQAVKRHISNFADGEIRLQIGENVRGKDVFIVQSLNPPAENLLELLLIIDASRRASARRITVVVPYFGYARQDRKEKPRVPITAKLIARQIESAGADRLLTMDLHAAQLQGFFEIPVDHLNSDAVFESFINTEIDDGEELVIVSPDVGGVKRIEQISEHMGASIAIIHKKREDANMAKALNIIGDVKNKTAILRDDIIDTGGTLAKASELIKRKGANKILAFCTHPLFSRDAASLMVNSDIDRMGITDTIMLPEEKIDILKTNNFIYMKSVSHLFSAAIKNIHLERSVSVLFGKDIFVNL